MKCEICNERDAEVGVKRMLAGKEQDLFVCRVCAQRAVGTQVGPLVEMLLEAAFDLQPLSDERICPGCGLSRSEFRQRERVGCARCYETFARELAPLLREMHVAGHHAGKMPERERAHLKRAEIEAALQETIRNQRYEDAAVLRDRLHKLDAMEKKDAPPAPGDGHAAS
jgi:protein arginine kinase activator